MSAAQVGDAVLVRWSSGETSTGKVIDVKYRMHETDYRVEMDDPTVRPKIAWFGADEISALAEESPGDS